MKTLINVDLQRIPLEGDEMLRSMSILRMEDRAFILLALLLTDIIGKNTINGQIFRQLIIQPRLKGNSPKNKQYTVIALIVFNLIVFGLSIYEILSHVADGVSLWIDGWIFGCLIGMLVEIVILSRTRIYILDYLLPSVIAEDVKLAESQLVRHCNEIFSKLTLQNVESHIELFSASNYFTLVNM